MKIAIKRPCGCEQIREVKDRKLLCTDGKIRLFRNYDTMNLRYGSYRIIKEELMEKTNDKK